VNSEAPVPSAQIHSTLTFSRSSASVPFAIDGDASTPAADPAGFHPGTSITLQVRTTADVAGVRMMSADEYRVQVPGSLHVTAAGHLHELGTLAVKAGTD
jgi:hypothetical protein